MLLTVTDSKGKPFIFMLSVKKQSMMAVCEVAITSGYTADEILNSSFCFTEIQFTFLLISDLYFMLLLVLLSDAQDSTV